MKKLLFLFLLASTLAQAQVTPDATIISNTDSKIRKATPVKKTDDADINDQLTYSKKSRVEGYTVSGTNTYTVSISWVDSYQTNLEVPVTFTNANTGASTINITGAAGTPLGVKSIVKNGSTALSGGEISAGQSFTLRFDGTNFQLLGGAGGGSISTGNLSTSTTGISLTGNTGAVVGSGTTINIQNATTSQPGLLTSGDWNTFNGKQAAGSYAVTTNNLSDLGNTGTARTNLGLGSAATQNNSFFNQTANNLSDVADGGFSRLNLRVPILFRARAVSVSNVASLSGTTTIDGVALIANDRVLLTAQSTASQNGPWLVQSGAWTRPTDFATGTSVQAHQILVAGGTNYAGSSWGMTNNSAAVIDTDAQTWVITNTNAIQTLTNKTLSGSNNTFSNISLSSAVTGNLSVNNLNSGTAASSSTFWRGDGTWASPTSLITSSTQTNDYILALSDAATVVDMNKATAINLTVPPNSSVAFPIGTIIYPRRIGAGQLTIVQGSGVTITSTLGSLVDAGTNVMMTLRKTGTDTWDLQNGVTVTFTAWTPTYTGFSSDPSGGARYVLMGKICFIYLQPTAGTSNATTTTFTLPFTAAFTSVFTPIVVNNGTQQAGRIQTSNGSNVCTAYATVAAGAWTASGTKNIQISGWFYEIQ